MDSDDARRIIGVIRSEYRRQDGHLRTLTAQDWVAPSFCADWQIYQVVSHLGSGAEILTALVRHSLLDGPPLGDAERKAIWAHFDSTAPGDMYSAYREANERLLGILESLTESRLGGQVPWFDGSPVPLAKRLTARLNDLALHTWDIVVMKDPTTSLTLGALPDILQFNLGRIAVLAKPELAGPLKGKRVQFDLTEPPAAVLLTLEEGGPRAQTGPGPSPDLRVATSTETFIRLLWGRYRQPASLSRLELDHAELRDSLIAAFPGR